MTASPHVTRITAAWMVLAATSVSAHSGPPYPVLRDHVAGPYRLSVWTDPDSTDDGSAGGRFWIVVRRATDGAPAPPETTVSVALASEQRPYEQVKGTAATVSGDPSQRYAALVMDREGRYRVRVRIDGPLGPATAGTSVDATYDWRPAPWLVAVYVMPFLLLGGLWIKLLWRRRASRSTSTRRT
jgi:hypothetical protein